MYTIVFSNLLNKTIHKTRCGWCGRCIIDGKTCRESTGEICDIEEQHWYEEQWMEEQYRLEYEQEEQRKLEEQMYKQLHYEQNPHLYN